MTQEEDEAKLVERERESEKERERESESKSAREREREKERKRECVYERELIVLGGYVRQPMLTSTRTFVVRTNCKSKTGRTGARTTETDKQLESQKQKGGVLQRRPARQ